jgi:predicted metal-dependent hydrolase
MSTPSAHMTVAGIDVDVVYKDIINLHIGVYPPMGRVRVAAPLKLDDDAVRLAVVQRLVWIRKHQDKLRNAQRQTQREMVSGESHFVWGVRYRLRVIEEPAPTRIGLQSDRLVLRTPGTSTTQARVKALREWEREQLRERIPGLIATWEPVVGRAVPQWSIRRMKTKWGSCNRETGHLWFNLELAKKHPDCLEYIVVHEMTHLRERGHGERFTKLMDGFLPDWRARRDQLNSSPLAEENWDAG